MNGFDVYDAITNNKLMFVIIMDKYLNGRHYPEYLYKDIEKLTENYLVEKYKKEGKIEC